MDYLRAQAFRAELRKLAEYAPGIPSKEISHELPEVKDRRVWEYAVHSHEADVRGHHFDLRLGDPVTGHAHSWALPPKLPAPGEVMWAIQQPTHTVQYMDFKGKIPSGYGAGKVGLAARSKTEILNARPGHVTFALYGGQGPEEYTLHRIEGKNWKLYNRTLTRADIPEVPTYKPDYRTIDIEKIDPSDSDHVMSVKIDDAHNLFVFQRGEPVRVVSHRPTNRDVGVIEHTHKVPALLGVKTPAEIANTVVRGGLYSLNPLTGRATPAQVLAGQLNANVWKSREGQREHGKLRPVIYDVVRWKGKDVSNAPYAEKLEILHAVKKAIPAFELPRMAHTEEEKNRLLSDLKNGRVKETKEGIVLWPLHRSEPPIKAKFTDEHDVYFRGTFAAEPGTKYEGKAAGGFVFSHTPNGKIVGKVGTGLSDAQRKDMHEHPEKYEGAVAKVHAMERYVTGALRAPSFKGWHLDKNDVTQLDQLVH